jgi:protein-S-isoprenylcysteine O-methyltransferase Ste14
MIILISQNYELPMSNTTPTPVGRRLLRWAAIMTVLALAILGLAGQWRDPWLWAYIGVFAVAALYPTLMLSDDLARERFRPPEPGADRVPLHWIRAVALAHLIVGLLDAGRWHLTAVPEPARWIGLAGMMLSLPVMFRAMIVNRFFSAVVRIQRERGHRVIDVGPYAIVRHPGYVGMITTVPFGALVIGSWLGFAIALGYAALILRRVVFEDAFLRSHLEGYAQYATRVRYRLVPGVW